MNNYRPYCCSVHKYDLLDDDPQLQVSLSSAAANLRSKHLLSTATARPHIVDGGRSTYLKKKERTLQTLSVPVDIKES